MRSHELAKILLERPDVELLLQEDPEGNGYRHLEGIDFDVVFIDHGGEDDWTFSIYCPTWSADDCGLTEEDWEDYKSRCGNTHAVLYPR